MADFEHPYIEAIVALEFPAPQDIIVTHGSALVIRGVREARPDGDIDLATTAENISYARRVLGWEALRRTTGYDDNNMPKTVRFTMSPDGQFDVYYQDFVPELYKLTGRGRVYPQELKLHSEQDDRTGLWVAGLDFVASTKRGTGRSKDSDDLAAIAAFKQR